MDVKTVLSVSLECPWCEDPVGVFISILTGKVYVCTNEKCGKIYDFEVSVVEIDLDGENIH